MYIKPRLLVILGAGSSISCGMPSVGSIDGLMKNWGREWVGDSPGTAGGDAFNVLWTIAKEYYGSNHYRIRPNYERILGEMTAMASWLSPSPFGTSLTSAVKDGTPVNALECLLDTSNQYAANVGVLEQHTFLLRRLTAHMRECSKAFDTRSTEFMEYREFCQKLRCRFDVGIYNLNYDVVACAAWPTAFNGFDCRGFFNSLSVSQRQEWGFIYRLHGSVHHCIDHQLAKPWIVWKESLDEPFTDCGVRQNDMAQDFKSIPLTTLISGGFKLDQLLADPYQTFYSTLVRHVHEADAILVVGYGFGDLHVNRALQNRFERPDHDTPYPQVVILEKSSPRKLQTASLQSHDFWAYQLTHTLKVRFTITKEHLEQQLTVEPVIRSGGFEEASDRVAIWHGGFEKAVPAVDRIIRRLSW